MDKIFKILAILLTLPAVALAQTDALRLNGNTLDLVNPAPTAGAINIVGTNPTPVSIWSNGTKMVQVDPTAVAITGNLKMSSTSNKLQLAPYTVTAAATPVEGTNDIKQLSIVPTAAANAAAGLPSSPTAGDTYQILNTGPNAIRVKAYGTPGINGAAAGTYIPLATFQSANCIATSATNWQCDVKTVPTPAGP